MSANTDRVRWRLRKSPAIVKTIAGDLGLTYKQVENLVRYLHGRGEVVRVRSVNTGRVGRPPTLYALAGTQVSPLDSDYVDMRRAKRRAAQRGVHP